MAEPSESALLSAVAAAPGEGLDSATLGWDSAKLVGLIKSLEADRLIESQARPASLARPPPGPTPTYRWWSTAGG